MLARPSCFLLVKIQYLAPGTPSQPFGFVFDANASPEFRPGAYASLTGPFIMALGPLGAGVYGPYGALGPLWQ